jgi:hypothetical protein
MLQIDMGRVLTLIPNCDRLKRKNSWIGVRQREMEMYRISGRKHENEPDDPDDYYSPSGEYVEGMSYRDYCDLAAEHAFIGDEYWLANN